MMKNILKGKVFAIWKISESYVFVDVKIESNTGFLPALLSNNIVSDPQFVMSD